MYSGDICLWPVYGWLCVSVRSEEGAEGSSAADSSAVSNKPPLQSASEQLFKHFHTVDDKTIEAVDHHDHHVVFFFFLNVHTFFCIFLSFQTCLDPYTDSHNVPDIPRHISKTESPVNS